MRGVVVREGLLRDVAVTMLCWGWFTAGFVLVFSWRYLGAFFFAPNREIAFQRLNSRFYQVFFRLLRAVAPKQRWRIDPGVAAIRSAVIICNHLSYLDPLLLISLFERQRTVVKSVFFRLPLFGQVIRASGYFPAAGEGEATRMMLDGMESMRAYLRDGGVLFLFPEGRRSRDGELGKLAPGALKIARMCGAPLYVVRLANTDRLFQPDTVLFRTGVPFTISLRVAARIEPEQEGRVLAVEELARRVRLAFTEQTA